MALRFNLSEIKDWETVTTVGEGDDRRRSPITEYLIFATIPLGMPKITEANWREFATRLAMWAWAHGHAGPDATVDDVKAHIGLGTNASPITKAKFNGVLTRALRERAEGAIGS